MSEENIQIGEFEIDPEQIPDAPETPLGVDTIFEVASAERKVTENEGKKSVRISLRAFVPELPGSQSVFATLWVTEQYKGKAHKSFAQFLKTVKLPYTTAAADLKGFRFVGKAGRDPKNPDYLGLSEVVSAA
jgi:hypothetical protein